MEVARDNNSLGKAAAVIGLIALVLSFVPFVGFVSWILAPLAMLFGLISLRKPSRSLAIVGLITGAIALAICFSWLSATEEISKAMNADTFNTEGEIVDNANAPIIDASVEQIWKDLEDNKVAAGKKYGGNRLRFEGEEIEDFAGDAENPALQIVGKRDQYLVYFVAASFGSDDGDAIAAMSKGEKVDFVCEKINEGFGDGYSLRNCKLT